MKKDPITPDRITKPIQLLGAWLVGLLTVDGAFLATAANMEPNSWQSGALTIAAIVNVPIFIGALFLLQTKFRPELQEDSYYSTYLNSRTNEVVKIPNSEHYHEQLLSKIAHLENKLGEGSATKNTDLSHLRFGVNVNLQNQDGIEAELSKAGVPLIRTFGDGSEKPELLKVAVADHLPQHVVSKVIALAKNLGFDHFSYIGPWEEIEEDVLLGAYGSASDKITRRAA